MRPRIRKPLPETVFEWFATRQAGHVARRQLLTRRVSPEVIKRRVRRGLLLPTRPGVYLLAHRAPAKYGREFAAVLACGPGALVSHGSAAAAFALVSYPATADVRITTTCGRGAELDGVRVARTSVLAPRDVWFAGWLPVTSPARTLLDLAGVVDAGRLEEAVATAQRKELVTLDELRRELARGNGRRGTKALRSLLERVAPPAVTRSNAERLMLRLIRAEGLPEPLVNERVVGLEVDFHWPRHRLVAEFDGRAFHSDIRAFRRDRERNNALQLAGLVVLRFTWEELTLRPHEVVDRLRRGLQLPVS